MIANASFEQALAPLQQGVAASWTATTVGTGEETAPFAGDSAALSAGNESFDHGWGTVDPQIILSGNAMTVQSREVETMSAWALNQLVLFLALSEAATFNSHTIAVEDFEAWVSSQDTNQKFEPNELEQALEEDFGWSPLITSLETLTSRAEFNGGDLFEGFSTWV